MIFPPPALAPRFAPPALTGTRALESARMRLLPAVQGAAAVTALGLTAEWVLRLLANRALGVLATARAESQPLSAPAATRTVVTEWVTIERTPRPQ
jgi:hypothetical protein